MDSDSHALFGGWGLALTSQQQQQQQNSSDSQLRQASGFPCSIASLFEDASQTQQQQQQQQPPPHQQQQQADQHPPSPSSPPAEPRFFLEYVVLENFKSYSGRHVLGPLQSSVAIIGANGSGKSNIADAICFGLGVTGRSLRSNALMDLRHTAGEEGGSPPTAVSLHFRRRASQGTEGEVLVLQRQITSGSSGSSSSIYSVDDKRVTAEEYRRILGERLSLGPHTIAASMLLQVVRSGDSSVTAAARNPLELTRLIERVGSSEDWPEQFAAAEARAATLRREARAAFSSKQQLLASLRVLQAQKKEVNMYKELQEKLSLLLQLFVVDRRAAQLHELETAETARAGTLLLELQQKLQQAETADQKRIRVSLQLEQRKTLTKKQAIKTSLVRAEMVECLERLRFAEQQQQQQEHKLLQKQQECSKLRDLENELSAEVIRLSDEQHRIKDDVEAKQKFLRQKLSQEQQANLLQLQQVASGRLAELKQQLATKKPLLQQATSALDILERECVELERRIACFRELGVRNWCLAQSEAQQKQTAAAETLQRLLKEAAGVKEAMAEAHEQTRTSAARREELLRLQKDLQEQLALVRGLQHDSNQHQQLLQVYEDLRTKAMLQDSLYGTAGECCSPSNKRFALAVAAAVGRWRNALVVKNVATANAAIQHLRSNRLQAVDFLPLDRLRERRSRCSSDEQPEISSEGGAFFEPPNCDSLPPQCRWAVDCVACDSELRAVVEFVLSDCIVVPSLIVAQQLKATPAFSKFRFVSLEGERLQHSGVYAIDSGAATAAIPNATGRMHALQHDELLRRAEEIHKELHKIDILESGGSEISQRRQQQLDRLHRLALQQQTKQKAWEQQQEQQEQQLQQLLQQHAQLRERCDIQKQRAATLAKEVEELQEASADAQAAAMARLSKELKLSQAELRDLLLEREQQQQQRSLAAKLHVQQLRLEAELKDCRNRLQDATETAEAAGAELKQQNLRDSLTQQLAKYEQQLEAAEQQHHERVEQQTQQQKALQEVEGQLQQLRDDSDRLLREKAAATAAAVAAKQQQQQQYAEAVHVLRQADALGVELPLQRGSWSDVQQFLSASEASHQPDSFSSLSAFFSMDWNALPSNLRQPAAAATAAAGATTRAESEFQGRSEARGSEDTAPAARGGSAVAASCGNTSRR
ncbi:structural maintenance of chromosomes protein 1A [Cyclospora cayetanensis]|uniref:Structural maintenance of chromosomes protein 1A n=1 Tax=Cyclospora cayetanensis TaxID=88456 RepID=A0A6P6S3A2_9EIME|nr:structural maintenance of chromosomes protein 1A [Cyclospora cayetanensis]